MLGISHLLRARPKHYQFRWQSNLSELPDLLRADLFRSQMGLLSVVTSPTTTGAV
jgi:hypothetical protein